jgi:hypothetical protein
MSEFIFGASRQQPTRKAGKLIDQIAKWHQCRLVESSADTDDYQRWFVGPDLGQPFNNARSAAVHIDLIEAGIYDVGYRLVPKYVAK